MFDDPGTSAATCSLPDEVHLRQASGGHIWLEEFLPGDYYSDTNNDQRDLFRVELTLTL